MIIEVFVYLVDVFLVVGIRKKKKIYILVVVICFFLGRTNIILCSLDFVVFKYINK